MNEKIIYNGLCYCNVNYKTAAVDETSLEKEHNMKSWLKSWPDIMVVKIIIHYSENFRPKFDAI